MIDNTIEGYKDWDKVFDYESTEFDVWLLDKDGNAMIKFGYPKFTKKDFDRLKVN